MGKSDLIFKLWEAVGYSPIPKCCGNCDNAAHVDWANDKSGFCNVLNGTLKFPITENGICKLHSYFKPGHVKWL
jgi:hypothetical protein